MPIFHDHYESPPQEPPSQQAPTYDQRQTAAHSGQGHRGVWLADVYPQDASGSIAGSDMDPTSPNSGRRPSMLNRVDLIERIKRGSSPSWQQVSRHDSRSPTSPETRPASRDRPSTPLLPAAELKSSRTTTPDPLRDHASAGYEIERPRSALHSGDFRGKKEESEQYHEPSSGTLATSPVAPWHHNFPAAAFPTSRNSSQFPLRDAIVPTSMPTIRSRAASQSSFSSSFVFLPPTSPLVQQSNNADLDFSSRPGSRQTSRSPERSNRRHTFSPSSFSVYQSAQMARSASGTPASRHLRKEGTLPYQAHQPRRSLTAFNQFQPHSSPQTPFVQSRRPSFSSDASPLHHAPMVGSYEESILRGRMSTTPSRPLDFVAQIGVLGRGQCKSNLKCPPHVTVPFPAVFYSYSSGNGRIADDSPSPYVGLVDLENSLASPEDNDASRRKRRHTVPNPDQDDLDFRPTGQDGQPHHLSKEDLRRKEKRKRRSTSPRAPQGGSYRIPQQGQLQIVIKNPNKTAVKLFLVPYDLSDMEPGQKTFIRQRSYSAGPIIDMPLSTRRNFGTDRPEAALSNSDDPNDRPILRYLIHLHICCPSKGRYYLYKSIRVVFANRVPDGKEKLRNEIQLPEPRYSTYKPARDSAAQQGSNPAAERLATEQAYRRRSAGFSLSHHVYDRMDGLATQPSRPPPAVQFTGGDTSGTSRFSSPVPDVQPIPFSLPCIDSRPTSREHMDLDPQNPFQRRVNASSPPLSLMTDLGNTDLIRTESFDKLNKGDVGYGGNAFCGVAASPGAGLLTQRLKGLDVQQPEARRDDESL
ncbi:hypothetical protein BDV96DRAFT_604361 [Lophiotrema nucula]|uniref:Atos-like conserved domain-containing protein n=1 Tax=Lophiotrema nucula TaxID=690887 RepID=A0A6A5YRX8_9PLEO|nr:hypothetical protein BDV96DRAFT_604361 [Lophiotrema nucula]